MSAKCSTCGGSNYDSVLLCLGCDSARDAERERLKADNARLRAALVAARWRVHHEICGTPGYDAAGNWREGETHEADCDAITEALK